MLWNTEGRRVIEKNNLILQYLLKKIDFLNLKLLVLYMHNANLKVWISKIQDCGSLNLNFLSSGF